MSYVIRLEDCRAADLQRVGGKCASLGELLGAGLPVPPGFAVTTGAFAETLAAAALPKRIQAELGELDVADVNALAECSARLRGLLEESPMPAAIETVIRDAYADLCREAASGDVPVAVRSSATAEDLPGTSFAGQQDTFLRVVGADAVLVHVKRCWSSLYTTRAIAYRVDNGFAHEKVLMSVGVQRMVSPRAAGVAMTLNPLNGDRSKIVIDSSFGLGETVVGGSVTPDNFVVDKVIFDVVKRTISPKHVELVPGPGGRGVVERPVESDRQLEPSITHDELQAVARLAKLAEQHYGQPQDVEWALDADTDEVFLLQSRPETVWSGREPAVTTSHETGLSSVLATLMNPLAAKKPPA